MRPLIGIPPQLDERGRWKRGRHYHYVDAAYAGAVEEAGGAALYLPHQRGADALARRIDGLLLPGGGDFVPPTAATDDPRFDAVAETQLAFDHGLLAAALGCRLPVFAICYGMQLLALLRGGRLIHHIPAELPDAGEHQLADPDARHAVRVEPGSLLEHVLGTGSQLVNSRHHQAVAEPGQGLRVCARAEDGVIEAIEDPAHAFCLGVQWHPEGMHAAHREALFGAFVAACAAGPAQPR